jgi:SWI/SNF-related matrix-associated actin-dependent regulator of chromatin subfamily A-like protein 1
MSEMREGAPSFIEDGPMNALEKMVQVRGQGGTVNFDEYMSDLQSESKGDNGMGGFMTAYRLSGEAKVKGVCEFVETLFENGAKFLIFTHHQTVRDEIQKFLTAKKVGHVRIDGKVPTEARHERVKAF